MAVDQVDQARNGASGAKRTGTPVLWHLKVSHYNEKARWALDHKRVPHLRRAATPGRHQAIAQRLTGGRTFPILVLDGESIGDSTRIIEALEHRYPELPLYPAAPEARRRALEIEDFFDEELGPYARLLALSAMLPDQELMLGAFAPDISRRRRLLTRVTFPLIRRRLIADFDINDQSIEVAWAKVRAAGERFRTELQPSGYLVGDSFTVADLTVAALVAPAVAPKQFPYPQPQREHPLLGELRAALTEDGLAGWAREIYARHVASRRRSGSDRPGVPPRRRERQLERPRSARNRRGVGDRLVNTAAAGHHHAPGAAPLPGAPKNRHHATKAAIARATEIVIQVSSTPRDRSRRVPRARVQPGRARGASGVSLIRRYTRLIRCRHQARAAIRSGQPISAAA
jgi:glutathione S-transferase